MRLILPFIFAILPGAALAHAGHVGELAGHDHVVAGIAIGAAIAVAAWGWLKGHDDKDECDDSAPDNEGSEA